MKKINQRHDTDLRLAVIGHTHRARIVVDDTEEHFFALIDCGAWIERCKTRVDDKEQVMENAQIGVLFDNDIRIYQLTPKVT